MTFTFPETIFAQKNSLSNQIIHLESECREVSQAFFSEPKIERVVEELLDVIHSAETALRIIQRQHDVSLNKAIRDILRKNMERNYYDNH